VLEIKKASKKLPHPQKARTFTQKVVYQMIYGKSSSSCLLVFRPVCHLEDLFRDDRMAAGVFIAE
jgi:hypothetical protein